MKWERKSVPVEGRNVKQLRTSRRRRGGRRMEQKGKESRKTGTERHNLSSLLTKGELIFLFFFLSFSPLFPLKPQKSSLVSANRVSLKPSHRTVSPTRKSLKISELETLKQICILFCPKIYFAGL